ncbi:MAG: hypothetical protein CM1200mP2_30930 [Planctomycetaceae bacterium]|nr:MAG: hypothetical protein CM1200mP2_30930 [Planctomycetaceae bacterium]
MDYLAKVLDEVPVGQPATLRRGLRLRRRVKGLVEVLIEAIAGGQGRVLWQQGVCAHQGSHAPPTTPPRFRWRGLFNKACHPLGPCLYLKQAEGIIRDGADPARLGHRRRPAGAQAPARGLGPTFPGAAECR